MVPFCFKKPLILWFFYFGLQTVFAQSMHVSEPINVRNDYGYELIGKLRDRILLFRDKYDEFEVQGYDSQMKLSWTREVEDLDRRGIQILKVVGGKNDFSIIHKTKRRGRYTLRLHKYDPGANLIDSMMVFDYGDRVFNTPNLEVILSEDRNCAMVLNLASFSQAEVTCFLLDRMKVLWTKTFSIRDDRFTSDLVSEFVLTNAGDLYYITERNNRKGRIEDHAFEILRINAGANLEIKVPAPDFMTNHAKFSYDHVHNRLVGAGLTADRNRERANGTFILKFDRESGQANLHFSPFDEKFTAVLNRKDSDDVGRGIDDAWVEQLIVRRDGGLLMVAERRRELQRGTAANRGFFREGSRLVMDFFYDDVFVIATQPDGTVHWRTVLHKKQYSQDDDGIFSSYFMFFSADKVRFLFNDEIKYENTCSEYILLPNGNFDRNSLFSTSNQSLRLRFRDAIQLNAGECLIPSESRGKLRLVVLRFG